MSIKKTQRIEKPLNIFKPRITAGFLFRAGQKNFSPRKFAGQIPG
jgi:hypothetical protein